MAWTSCGFGCVITYLHVRGGFKVGASSSVDQSSEQGQTDTDHDMYIIYSVSVAKVAVIVFIMKQFRSLRKGDDVVECQSVGRSLYTSSMTYSKI